jgi:hypothetical protein
VCCICQAAYTPSRSHAYLLQGPPIALESALMSMCHFCFRCRRPSCPACWDEVHGVCGQCSLETGLPFRLEPAPLDGARFTPTYSPDVLSQSTQSSLVNVRPGRFQRTSSPIDIDPVPTRPDFTGTPSPVRIQRSRPLEIDEIETRPDTKRSPARSSDIAAAKTRPDRTRRGRRQRMRWLALLILVLVVLIILLVIATLLLPNINTFLHSLLHIDIRTEIARFWHKLQSLF